MRGLELVEQLQGIRAAGREGLAHSVHGGLHPRHRAGQLGVRSVGHERFGLGHVLLGLGEARLQVAQHGPQGPFGLADRLGERVHLAERLLGGTHGQRRRGAVLGFPRAPRLREGGLHELEPLPGLRRVVRDLGEGGLRVLAVQRGDRRLGVLHPGPGLGQAGFETLEGLGHLVLEVAQGVELLLVRRQGRTHGLAALDDLLEPGALLGLGVRDLVVELVLELERGPHVLLGLVDVLAERRHGLLPVGRLGEAQLLFRGADGVVRGHELRAGLGAQLLHAELVEGVAAGLLGAAPFDGATLRAPPAAGHEHAAAHGRGHRTCAEDRRQGPTAVGGALGRAPAARGAGRQGAGRIVLGPAGPRAVERAVGGVVEPLHRGDAHREPFRRAGVRADLGQLRAHVGARHLVLQVRVPAAVQPIGALLDRDRQDRVVRPEPALARHVLGQRLGVRAELIHVDDVQPLPGVPAQVLDLLGQPLLIRGRKHTGLVHHVYARRHRHGLRGGCRHQEAQTSQARGGHGTRQTADIGGAGEHGHVGSPSTAEASRRTGRTRRILGLSVGRRGNRAPGIRRGRNRGRSGRSADL